MVSIFRGKIFQLFAAVLVLFFLLLYLYKIKDFNQSLFEKIPFKITNVDFSNDLTPTHAFNIYTYNNFYSGGGVALGDINNDGLLDIYFTANQKENRLYLNKGNFEFKDITHKANVAGTKPWSTGASMVDINGDGLLDIYVCNAGLFKGTDRKNELFINNGNLTFTEQAGNFGIADSGFSIQSTFFDYDHDGDLDMYLLNYTSRPINNFDPKQNLRQIRNYNAGDRLYKNNLVLDSLHLSEDNTPKKKNTFYRCNQRSGALQQPNRLRTWSNRG